MMRTLLKGWQQLRSRLSADTAPSPAPPLPALPPGALDGVPPAITRRIQKFRDKIENHEFDQGTISHGEVESVHRELAAVSPTQMRQIEAALLYENPPRSLDWDQGAAEPERVLRLLHGDANRYPEDSRTEWMQLCLEDLEQLLATDPAALSPAEVLSLSAETSRIAELHEKLTGPGQARLDTFSLRAVARFEPRLRQVDIGMRRLLDSSRVNLAALNDVIGDRRERLSRGQYGKQDFLEDLDRWRGAEDHFTDHLLGIAAGKSEPEPNEDACFYQATSARNVLAALDAMHLQAGDVLYDLGAGRGKVAMMAAWLTPATAVGVELVKPYVDNAVASARSLNLTRATFVHADVTRPDYADGTHFYVFNPFWGKTWQTVMGKLHQVAERREIVVGSLGTSTQRLQRESWLRAAPGQGRIDMFQSAAHRDWNLARECAP